MLDFIFITKLVVTGVIVFFVILFVGTAFLEKRMVRQFVPVDPASLKLLSPYFVAVNESARELGFAAAGTYKQDRNSRFYKGLLALWVSPDGTILVVVMGGKNAGIPIKRTVLASYLSDDRVLQSADNFDSPDLTGLFNREVLLNAHLEELITFHRDRLGNAGAEQRHFNAATAFRTFESFEAMRADRLEEMGLARYIDTERTIWRHTFKGAVQLYTSFRRSLGSNTSQHKRIRLKRPGDT